MAFERDRIDGGPSLPLLRPDNVLDRGDEAMIELRLSADHEIELNFPAPGGKVEATWLELAADVLAYLTAIDNEVQRVSAEQFVAATHTKKWADTPYPSSYFEGKLAYITLSEGGGALLRYWVIGCNSEWDERFVRIGGRWTRVVVAEPSAAADTGHM